MKTINYLLSFVLLFLLLSCSQSNLPKEIHSKVLIMPIMPRENFPFKFDQDRKMLVWNFQSRGFIVDESQSTWSRVISTNLDLTKIQDADIVKISKLVSVDLIICSNGKKVYDCNKNQFIIDTNSYQPTQDLALYLKSLGY